MRGNPPVPWDCKGFRTGGALPDGGGKGKAAVPNDDEDEDEDERVLLASREGEVVLKVFGDEGTDCIRGCVIDVGDIV